MRLTKCVSVLSAATLIAGCSAYSSQPTTTILPSSNKAIDIVLHRGDVRVLDCATLAVLQTYNGEGSLIDSKEARGTALHCTVIPALIDAGGRVGAAAMVRPAITTIKNAVSAGATGGNATATGTGTGIGIGTGIGTGGNATGGNGGEGGTGGTGGQGGSGGSGGQGGQGNNGGGNGDNDGTNNGSDNHHDNGDNS